MWFDWDDDKHGKKRFDCSKRHDFDDCHRKKHHHFDFDDHDDDWDRCPICGHKRRKKRKDCHKDHKFKVKCICFKDDDDHDDHDDFDRCKKKHHFKHSIFY